MDLLFALTPVIIGILTVCYKQAELDNRWF